MGFPIKVDTSGALTLAGWVCWIKEKVRSVSGAHGGMRIFPFSIPLYGILFSWGQSQGSAFADVRYRVNRPVPTPYQVHPYQNQPYPPQYVPPPPPLAPPVYPTVPGQYNPNVPLVVQPPPPPRREEAIFGIRGLKAYYAQGGVGFAYDAFTRNDPGDLKPKTDTKYTLLDHGLVGWGPLRSDKFLFYSHYKYSQNYGTEWNQILRFKEQWFGRMTADNFIFPTRSMLRVHEIASDVRFVHPVFQLGLFSRLSQGHIGSRFLGESGETSEIVVRTESFVPYLSFRYGKIYRGQISIPFRTEINKEDERLNNATYSWKSGGRGRLFSATINNAFHIPRLGSLLFLDMFSYEYRYFSVQNDRSQLGLSASFDFPIIYGLRAAPKFAYYQEKYAIDRVRIKDFTKGAPTEVLTPPNLLPRSDTTLAFGASSYLDLGKRNRLFIDFMQEGVTSGTKELAEFNSSRTLFQLGFAFSWPTTTAVWKRVHRFGDNVFAEEF